MLYIQAVQDFSTTNALVELVYSGFDIPEIDEWPELNLFDVRTFTVFTKYPDGPSRAYNPVNEFFTTLTIEEQKEIATSFAIMHCDIMLGKDDASDVTTVVDNIGEVIDQLDIRLNLCDRLVDFVEHSSIPISDMEDAGKRAQDTKPMTFVREEGVIVTSICVLMKMLSPITGVFIAKYTHVIDNKYKEIHTQTIMTKLFTRKYYDLIVKFNRYVTRLVETKISITPTAIFGGCTLDSVARLTIDMILVKKFAGVNLYEADGNIIKYVASCCGSNVESSSKNASATNAVKIISDPTDMDQDEGNQSRLESESRQSAKTADFPILISIAAKHQCKKVIEMEEIDAELIERTFAYYRANTVFVNPITECAVATYYGADLGGGAGIFLLQAPVMSQLAAVLQILCVQRDAPMLGHVLTANCPATDKIPDSADCVFMNQWKSTLEYQECKRILPAGFGEKEWDTKLKDIALFLTTKTLTYNTAPAVWELCDVQVRNGKTITDQLEIMVELMRFIKIIYKKRSLSL